MKLYIKDNKIKVGNEIVIYRNGVQVINPSEEIIISDGWQKFVIPQAEPCKPTYEERVEQLIREKYSVNQEFAIQRQRETKPEEFKVYFAYCEECKATAKEEFADVE